MSIATRFVPSGLLLFAVVALAVPASASSGWNMTPGVTEISRAIYDLHMLIFWICVAIGVVVFGAMLISIILHRKSRGVTPATFHESTKLEIVWTLVPLGILIGMAIPATSVLVQMYDSGGEDMVVEVRGYQWRWQYKYLDDDLNEQISFFSNLSTPREQILGLSEKGEHYLLEVDNPLVIPINRKVRFLLTSNDVIHAWWVPDFALKRDAIPGFINDMWTIVEEPGIYRGQCAELCGIDHGFMPIVVHALPEDEYDAWYAEQLQLARLEEQLMERDWSEAELLARGEEVYSTHCVGCHQADGQGVPPVFPALAGNAMMTGDFDAHMEVVYHGRAGTAMQAFGPVLSPVDMASVMNYQRHAFGKAGATERSEPVKPKDIVTFAAAQ
jgi:cytochrome c oxidase subunit 2